MYLGRIVEIMNGAAFRMHARHPYTKALLSSVFSIDDDPDKEIYVLDGEAQSATGTYHRLRFLQSMQSGKRYLQTGGSGFKTDSDRTSGSLPFLSERHRNSGRNDDCKIDLNLIQKFIHLK